MEFSRRQFLGTAVAATALTSLVNSTVFAEERRRSRGDAKGGAPAAGGGPLSNPLVDSNDAAAKAVNYVKQHSDIKDAKLKSERQGTAWDQQFCKNCSFYKEVGDKDGGKVGTCTIFANKLVSENAWCTSWNKKA